MNRRAVLGALSGSITLFGGCIDSAADGDTESEPTREESAATDDPVDSDGEADSSVDDADQPDESGGETATSLDETADSERKTLSPGDAIDRSFTVENEGSNSDSVLVTLTAIDPDGRPHLDENVGHETIDLDPGEIDEVTLSWTPDEEVPEGEYDLWIAIWMETDLDDRVTVLDERTESNAFAVEKPIGSLFVTTTPSDAMVVVDGELLGDSPIELPVGSYEVTVVHEEYETATETVTVTEAETTAIEIDLTDTGPD